jgi:hypothetical protein
VHPIERLRYVARATGADQGALVRETAGSLGGFRDDPAGLVMALRRMLARHLTAGSLWWFASRACTAADPLKEAWAALEELEKDPTLRVLARELPDDAAVCVVGWPDFGTELTRRGDLEVLVVDAGGQGGGLIRRLERADVDAVDVPAGGVGAAAAEADLVVIEASVLGPDTCLAMSGSRAAAAVARTAGKPVWLVAPTSRIVPKRLWDVIASRFDADREDPWDRDEEFVPLDLVDLVIGPDGGVPVADALRRCSCPVAPELFKEGVL